MAERVPAAIAATLLAGVALLLAALFPPQSEAAGEPNFGCGHEHVSPATPNPDRKGLAPVAIGDSTILLPIPELNKVGFDVNGLGCRGFKQSVWVARDLRNHNRLPHLVLINAYGNGGVNPDLIKFALKVLGPDRVLGLITAYNADTGEAPAPDTDVIVQAAKDHPDQIKLLDWVKYSLPHHSVEPTPGAWFLPDLFHPNFAGAHAYAEFLAAPFQDELTPAPSEESGGGTPWWPFAVGAAVLAALAVLFLRRRRA
jgi:MYXO-CTERM domain-containing protein